MVVTRLKKSRIKEERTYQPSTPADSPFVPGACSASHALIQSNQLFPRGNVLQGNHHKLLLEGSARNRANTPLRAPSSVQTYEMSCHLILLVPEIGEVIQPQWLLILRYSKRNVPAAKSQSSPPKRLLGWMMT